MEAISKSKIYDDVIEALELFKGRKYLASMQSQKVLEIFLEKHNLRKYFYEVLGRERFGSKRKQLEHILEREKGNKVYFIDDLKRNIDSCNDLEIECILLKRWEGETLLDIIKILF
jgi:phosphoglycolate phosphatase-like HAD superfamily hydrolase